MDALASSTTAAWPRYIKISLRIVSTSSSWAYRAIEGSSNKTNMLQKLPDGYLISQIPYIKMTYCTIIKCLSFDWTLLNRIFTRLFAGHPTWRLDFFKNSPTFYQLWPISRSADSYRNSSMIQLIPNYHANHSRV